MKQAPDGSYTFIGGATIDLGSRYYGMRKLRATFPFIRLSIYSDRAELSVRTMAALAPDLPLPIVMPLSQVCIVRGRIPPTQVGFRIEGRTHHFVTFKVGRIMGVLDSCGYKRCS